MQAGHGGPAHHGGALACIQLAKVQAGEVDVQRKKPPGRKPARRRRDNGGGGGGGGGGASERGVGGQETGERPTGGE